MCGGIADGALLPLGAEGLSPRVRGNLKRRKRREHREGSIPACAGESSFSSIFSMPSRVYPRVCGGISILLDYVDSAKGLSPRVRGNPAGGPLRARYQGSIPACAGESALHRASGGLARVYPRVCGGINNTLDSDATFIGLSPRVRGNRQLSSSSGLWVRSIPACAGESSRQYSE